MSSEPVIFGAWLNLPRSLQPWLGIAMVLAASRLLLAAVGELARRHPLAPELSRKLLHLGMGTILLMCPWLFDRCWPLWLLAGVFVGLLVARLYFPRLQYHVAGVIYGVDRRSFGEYYFPLIAALLFTIARRDALLYTIPLSLLVYADAAAALVGTRYGSARLKGCARRKTLEGSAAFIVTAFITTHVPLLLSGRVGASASLLTGLLIACAGAAIEASCANGLDNLAVPAVAFVVLRIFQ